MTTTTTTPPPKSSRFQIMRDIIRHRMDNRVGCAVSKHSDKIRTTRSKSIASDHAKSDGFTEGVFFRVPSTASLLSSDSSVTSKSSSVSSASSGREGKSHQSLSSSTTTMNNNETSTAPPNSWKSTERKSFLLHQPLMVCDPEKVDIELESDPVAALGKVMARSKKLPSTDYYCSNHIMVNDERVQRMVAPLSRLRELDDLARYHAEEMAKSQRLYHCDPTTITHVFQRPYRRIGENVFRGTNIRDIHTNMMTKQQHCSDKYNILHRCYTHMGMGTAKGDDGQLYLCQIFRG